jgi:diacylglycerol O-acyltransferase / wax synthase
MQQLTGIDASFLYLESSKSPMHIGGVYLFAPPAKGEMTFKDLRNYIESRLHTAKPFRQRIVESPLNLGHPYWIEDPHFNLDQHLFHTALPKPGGRKELRAAAAQAFSRTLDRSRPLWDLTFVEGLDGFTDLPKGSFALISKIHHAAIDGASGAEMMGSLFSLNPDPDLNTPFKPWQPERIPSSFELLGKNIWNTFGTPIQFGKFVLDSVGNVAKVAYEAYEKAVTPPPLPFTAPATPFNTTITGSRVFGGVEFELAQIKAMKNVLPNTTINDVILAVCSGAFRKYLLIHEKLPQKSLIAMAPISVRSDDQKQAMGNQVSAMLVSLATVEPDPIRRLQLINESSRNSKTYSKAVGASQLMNFIPSTLAALGARLYTTMKMSEMHTPYFNLVITNVPGPPMPLYMNGAKLLHHYGTAPVLDGLGLLMVVFSYAGHISVSATSTPEIIPDMEVFLQCFLDSRDELHQALLGKSSEKLDNTPVEKVEPTASETPVKSRKTKAN